LNWLAPNIINLDRLTGYTIYRNHDVLAFVNVDDGTTYTDHAVVNGIEYLYYVVAEYVDPDGSSDPSNFRTGIPTGPTLHPPANLNAINTPATRNVMLSWVAGTMPINEGFETQTLNSAWLNIDNDEDGNSWEISTEDAIEDYQCIISRSVGLGVQENWLITQQFSGTMNSHLNYWIGAGCSENYAESYKVMVSNGSTDIEDFTLLYEEILTKADWQRRSISLSQYNMQQVRFAFVHNTRIPASYLKLDGVQVVRPDFGRGNNSRNDRNRTNFRIYRNGMQIGQVTQNTYTYPDLDVPLGIHEYFVRAIYDSEYESSPGNVRIVEVDSVSVKDITVLPEATMLRGNFPNPFNPETIIAFDIANHTPVTIEIFNVRGQKIYTLVNENMSPGSYRAVWTGKDSDGRSVASGVYFYRMVTNDYRSINKMMMMK
jgi:hypothetical protein